MRLPSVEVLSENHFSSVQLVNEPGKFRTPCHSPPTSVGNNLKSEVDKLLKKHQQLNQLDSIKVVSHVQRKSKGWVLNTILLDGYDVPFKYSRKTVYRSLKGARINLTYYPQNELIAGLEIETMKVVRIKKA